MSYVSPSVDDRAKAEEALLLKKRDEVGSDDLPRAVAIEIQIQKVRHGMAEAVVEGASSKRAIPMDDLSAMEKTLMTDVWDKSTLKEAVLQIYDNMFNLTGWKYNASKPQSNGKAYTQGGVTVGMCESYRNAFHEALKCYNSLRAAHPSEAIREGLMSIEEDQTYVNDRFCTRVGLTLMGGLRGNVYLEVDGDGTPMKAEFDGIKRFVFKGHWTLKVDGEVYDPIFYSIGEDNVDLQLDNNYVAEDGSRFIPNVKAPIESGEFGATFIWVHDWKRFEQTVKNMTELYTDKKDEIDQILKGALTTQEGMLWKTDRDCYVKAKQYRTEDVADPATFRRVVCDASQVLKQSQITAVGKVLDLAAK